MVDARGFLDLGDQVVVGVEDVADDGDGVADEAAPLLVIDLVGGGPGGDMAAVDVGAPELDGHAVVVLAAEGYPGTPRKGDVISLPSRIPAGTGIIHSGTVREDNGTITTAGGRVLGVTARGTNLAEAAKSAYALISQIHFEGMHYRRDIGARQLRRDADKP